MSPFGGYGAAGLRRVRSGAKRGFERSKRGGFALAGKKKGEERWGWDGWQVFFSFEVLFYF